MRRHGRIDVAGETGQPRRRPRIVQKVRAFEMRIERREIEGIAGQENAVVAVQQADGVRGVPGRAQDLELPAAKVDHVSFVDNPGDRERTAAKLFDDEALGQRLPDPALLEELCDGFRRAARRTAARVLGVAAVYRLELVVAANVVVVRV